MASERSAYVAASELTLQAAWDVADSVLERPSESRALTCASDEPDAAEVSLLAASQTHGPERHALLHRAAEQLLLRGQVERALSVLRALVGELDLAMPESSPALQLQRAVSQLQLKVRGWKRPPRSRPGPRALQLQTLRTLATGLAEPAPARALAAALRYVDLAQDAPDNLHRVRALGLSAALSGEAALDKRWARRALSRVDSLVVEDGSAEAQGFASLIHALICQQHDQLAAARVHASAALSRLDACSDVEWELDQANLIEQVGACAAGDFAATVHRTPALVDGALQRGRAFQAAKLLGACGFAAWLVSDDVEAYRRMLAQVRQRLPRSGRADGAAHWLLLGEATLALYIGEPASGHAALERAFYAQPAFMQHQRKAQSLLHTLRQGQCAASALGQLRASGPSSRRSRLRGEIELCIRTLERHDIPARISAAECLRAALALDSGLWLPATHRLAAALQLQAAAGLEMSAAATRRRLGQLTGGVAGRQVVASAEASMRAQGIKNLEAMTELLCPGVRG